MIKRWSSGRSVTLRALLFSLFSVAAFLDSAPLHNSDTGIRKNQNYWIASQLKAKSGKDDRDEAGKGLFSKYFSFGKEEEAEEIVEESSSTSVLNAWSKWREGRKIKAEIEAQEIETSDRASESWKFLPDSSTVTQLFRRSANKDESRPKEDSEKEKKAAAQRERIRKIQGIPKPKDTKILSEAPLESEEASADANSEDSRSTRSNPLSVAQKFVSGVLSKQKPKEEWIAVASKTSIAPGALVPVSAAGLDLLLVASKDGSALHCIANSCPHLGTPLEIGILERRPIEYPETDSDSAIEKSPNFQETYIAKLLAQDGCEDCIVCPLHQTAFALDSGQVRGVSIYRLYYISVSDAFYIFSHCRLSAQEWCPYPPVVGKIVGAIKPRSNLPVFDVRTKGKNIEVRLNTPFLNEEE